MNPIDGNLGLTDSINVFYSDGQSLKIYDRSLTYTKIMELEQEEKLRRKNKNTDSPHYVSKALYLKHILAKGDIDLDNVSRNFNG